MHLSTSMNGLGQPASEAITGLMISGCGVNIMFRASISTDSETFELMVQEGKYG